MIRKCSDKVVAAMQDPSLKLYPSPDDSDPGTFFASLLKKREIQDLHYITRDTFSEEAESDRESGGLEPHQVFARQYFGPQSRTQGLLLFHETGTGKTGAAIAIAETNRWYAAGTVRKNIGRVYTGNPSDILTQKRILVLVKNKTIEDNFISELAKELFTGNTYLTNSMRKALEDDNPRARKRFESSVKKIYEFQTFGRLANSLTKNSKNPGETLNHRLVLIDEAHNIVGNRQYELLHAAFQKSVGTRIVLMTATPMFDSVTEIFSLINLVMGYPKPAPQSEIEFFDTRASALRESDFITTSTVAGSDGFVVPLEVEKMTKTGASELRKRAFGRISFVRVNRANFPQVNYVGLPLFPNKSGSIVIFGVEASSYQQKIMDRALEADSGAVRRSLEHTAAVGEASAQLIAELDSDSESEQETIHTNAESQGETVFRGASDAALIVFPDNQYGSAGFTAFTRPVPRAGSKHLGQSREFIPGFREELQTQDGLQKYSSKLDALINNLKKTPGPAFVFTETVNKSGLEVIAMIMELYGYRQYSSTFSGKTRTPATSGIYAILDGATDITDRRNIITAFNSNANKHGAIIRVLLGSRAVSEGVTLLNIRQIHIVEPPWNRSRIQQAEGRGIRNYSHVALPPVERQVNVYLYATIAGPGARITRTIDEIKYRICEAKDRAIKAVELVLKRIAVDCAVNAPRNALTGYQDGSRECHYTKCALATQCTHATEPEKIFEKLRNASDFSDLNASDYSTVLGTAQDANAAVELDLVRTREFIKSLFGSSPVWSLDDIKSAAAKSRDAAVTPVLLLVVLDGMIAEKVPVKDSVGRLGYIMPRGNLYVLQPFGMPVAENIYDLRDMPRRFSARAFEKGIKNTLESNPTYQEILARLQQTQEKTHDYHNRRMKYVSTTELQQQPDQQVVESHGFRSQRNRLSRIAPGDDRRQSFVRAEPSQVAVFDSSDDNITADKLSNEIKEYNENIKNTHEIYGTYFNSVGVFDRSFRIVMRTADRLVGRTPTGRSCMSMEKPWLIDIAKKLGMQDKFSLKTNKNVLCTRIREELEQRNAIQRYQ